MKKYIFTIWENRRGAQKQVATICILAYDNFAATYKAKEKYPPGIYEIHPVLGAYKQLAVFPDITGDC